MPRKIKAMLRRTGTTTASTLSVMQHTPSAAWKVGYSTPNKGTNSYSKWAAHSNQATYDSSSVLNSQADFTLLSMLQALHS